MTITVVCLQSQSTIDYKNERRNYRSSPYFTNTTNYNSSPYSTSTQTYNSSPYSTSTQTYDSSPYSTSTQNYNSSINSPNYDSRPYTTITPNYNQRPYSNSSQLYARPSNSNRIPGYNKLPHSTNSSKDNNEPLSVVTHGISMDKFYDYYNDDRTNDEYVQEYIDYYFFDNSSSQIKPVIVKAIEFCPSIPFCTLTLADNLENTLHVNIHNDENGRDGGSTSDTNILSSQCCLNCSCLPSCVATKNCCPDALNVQEYSSNTTSCLSVASTLPKNLQTLNVDPVLQTITYNTIVDCNITGLLDEQEPLFEDVVMVSTEKWLYPNRSCALSHGETDFVRYHIITLQVSPNSKIHNYSILIKINVCFFSYSV